MSPLLRDYRVGIVVSAQGPNAAQITALAERLAQITKVLPEDGQIHVYIPGFGLADPEQSVSRPLRNMLERKGKVRLIYIGTRSREGGVAQNIVSDLIQVKRCDEIWCCPSDGQVQQSTARVAQVYRIGAASAYHQRYKLIPPWVEAPAPQQATQAKKGKKSWRDMFNKRSFLW